MKRERRPPEISRSHWFSLPRGSRMARIREEHDRVLFAIEWAIDAAEQRMAESLTAGLYGEAP